MNYNHEHIAGPVGKSTPAPTNPTYNLTIHIQNNNVAVNKQTEISDAKNQPTF